MMKLYMNTDLRKILPPALMLSLYVFVITPLNILFRNYEEFNYGVIELLFESSAYFFLTFAILILAGVVLLNEFLKKYENMY